MPVSLRTLLGLSLVLPLAGQQPDSTAIMTKMAANTAAAVEARRQFVYREHARASLLLGNGRVVCKESREYDVVPQENRTEKKLTDFRGECRDGKNMVQYAPPSATPAPGLKEKGAEGDNRESIAGFLDDLTNDPKSRDGIPHDLFPLSSDDLPSYRFTLKGEATVNGRRAFQILFEPAELKGVCVDVGDDKSQYKIHADLNQDEHVDVGRKCHPWKGEIWVDAEDLQPVRITTSLAKEIPWGIRVFMGIDIKQLGFSLSYRRVAPGVWFPATYGTEFHIQAFWAYKRTLTLSMENSDFRKASANSTVQFESPE